MNSGISYLSDEYSTAFNEFTTIGVSYDKLFAHQWFIGCDISVDKEELKNKLDGHLKLMNDDYAIERKHGLKDVFVTLVPNAYFNEFLKTRGKEGGQTKFPRVLKGNIAQEWVSFLKQKNILTADANIGLL